MPTTPTSLEDLLRTVPGPVELLRNSRIGPYVYPVVPAEFTNWRDEQQAWQKSCVLFNQSFHMTDMYVEGPDAPRLLSDLGINGFTGFGPDRAKQFVACNHDGHVIGDVVLFCLGPNRYNLVGRPSTHNWVQYNCETGGYDATCERDERAAVRTGPIVRKAYRFQVQGPNALKLLEKLTGAAIPDLRFFHMGAIRIAGRHVRALRHGMAGQPGLELFGPWEEGDEVKAAIVAAGRDFGLRQVGARAYSSNTLESGWIPSPMPAIYTGARLEAYRRWLPATGYEATLSLGGSFVSGDIRDYYLTPWDLGYGSLIRFDHDFVGREALQAMADEPHRRKVTLELDPVDVTHAIGSLFGSANGKFFDWPSAVYATLPYDKVTRNGRTIGISTWCGYSFNERRMLTLAMLDAEHAEPGTEVTFVWGEPDGGTRKSTVEPHVQTEIRATVSPVPYSRSARADYRRD